MQNGSTPRPGVAEAARRAADMAQAFHWWQAFPQVRAKGGFDVLLGNPPWERIKLQEEEFFASRSPLVAEAPHKAERGRRIALLAEGMLLHTIYPEVEAAQGLVPPNAAEQALFAEFLAAKRGAEAASLFAHDAGRYPLTGVGDVNTYALFAETFAQLVSAHGRAGFIVPTGIATDDSTKAFFAAQTQNARLVSLYDIENRDRLFPAVDSRMKFCLLTLGAAPSAEFVCFATQVTQLTDPRRRFGLTPQDFALINPNTLTCPVFRSERDAELTKKLYSVAPVLIAEGPPAVNPWGIRFMAMIHMSNDSQLFADSHAPGSLPLYEAKMIHQFDHRWASYGADGNSSDVAVDRKNDPNFSVTPRYWIDERVVLLKISRLPKLLLDQLRDGNGELVVLSMAIILFSRWLQTRYADRREACSRHLYSEWRAFVEAFPFARNIDPTQTGLGGDNPTGFRPLDDSYLPCAPIDKIVATERECTGWIAADPRRVEAYLGWFPELAGIVDLNVSVKTEEDALELAENWLVESCPKWLMGWRDICRATDERTVIAGLVPRVGVGNKMPLFLFGDRITPQLAAAFYANLGALVFDFVARQKIGGTTLNYFYLKQFPVLPPNGYTDADLTFIAPRVLELTYTAHDLAPWAADLGYTGEPFAWSPERRAQLRAELDAYYARLYGLTRDELRYILDPADVMGKDYPSETFRVLKNSELREFCEYRTRRLVLEAWDALHGEA